MGDRERGPKPERLRRSVALFAIAAALSIRTTAVLGSALRWAMASSSACSCSPYDGWCGLGVALVGIAFGIAVGVIAYITAGVITITRYRPPGRRAAHIAAHLTFPFALVATLTLLS